ncbi:hypothetical protein OO007_17410 [Cocleimonas sp. KMM 6892]|uniref:hypothetical protein n=1 Tax=unclassified Cocleimonas TaxID=2639732 RepID=UPI002DB74A75|nr:MULTISPECIES: hypothetical protein [unclassified Cocleimonas]MEB8434021.1 hypothetical protein [Cocleimonas sp. KMM 6892]MEC4716832.1 hypothetical protein [Cocleimonas sp. KMM 6895]MEC4746013.1 hypothetical protein [Cocleimonas sp. KMM 6896]
MIKLLTRAPLMVLLAFMITACGGGSTSSVVNAIIDANDDVVDTLPRWTIGDMKFAASSSKKNSLANYDVLTTTSLGLNEDGEIVTSIVALSYKDNGPGVYTLVSSLDQLLTRQTENPLGNFILITASIINIANDSTTYNSDDSGFANVTLEGGDLVFNIPSPVGLIRGSGDAFPQLPFNILFTLIDIFEDLPTPLLPKPAE